MSNEEAIVKQYCADAFAGENESLELEVRFTGVEFAFFESMFRKLLASGTPVNSMGSVSALVAGAQARNQSSVTKIRQKILCRNGKPASENNYYTKRQLASLRVPAGKQPAHKLVLSVEKEVPDFVIEQAQLRVKKRASFELPGQNWRVDMTVVRTLQSQEKILKNVVGEMGLKTCGPVGEMLDFLTKVGTETERTARQRIYRYEIELEHTGERANLDSNAPAAAMRAALEMVDPKFLAAAVIQDEIYFVAEKIIRQPKLLSRFQSEWGLKQLTPQVKTLTRVEYSEIYPPVGFFLTDKADGVHALAVLRDMRLVIVAPGSPTELLEYALPSDTSSVMRARARGVTIIDGELVTDKKGPRFLAFDVVMLTGQPLHSQGFEVRVENLAAAVELAAAVREGPIPLRVEAKPFERISTDDPKSLVEQFKRMHGRKRDYENDGIILYEPGNEYAKTRIFKWKPAEQNTIDFLAKRPPRELLGKKPYLDAPGHELHFLFVGVTMQMFRQFGMSYCPSYSNMIAKTGNRSNYFPIQFQPSDAPMAYLYQRPTSADEIDGKIVEMVLDVNTNAWKMVRVRHDKQHDLQEGTAFGNDFRTAELNYLNYRDPLTLEMLGERPVSYFAVEKSNIYNAPTAFMSLVKTELIQKHLRGASCVVDLGVGKGQDLGRYLQAQIKRLIAVDSDRQALAELVRRKFTWHERRAKGNLAITLRHVDFAGKQNEVAPFIRDVPDFPKSGADSVVSFLASHYAFKSVSAIGNFALLCRNLLKPGGTVILTLMDGERVVQQLNEAKAAKSGESWDEREPPVDGVLKYSVRRWFSDAGLSEAGQKIAVLLPFSDSRYYEEYLSNIDTITKVFLAKKFTLASREPLWDTFESKFRTEQPHKFKALTEADKKWLRLFVAVRFIAP